jgi:hypothetical protein
MGVFFFLGRPLRLIPYTKLFIYTGVLGTLGILDYLLSRKKPKNLEKLSLFLFFCFMVKSGIVYRRQVDLAVQKA